MSITVQEAAKLLNVPRKNIDRWVRDGKIPFHRSGDQLVFERFEIFQFALAEHLNPLPVLAESVAQAESVSAVAALKRGGIFYDVPGATKREVLHNALRCIEGIDQATVEPLFELFMAREELASTGIGNGIAIPHARGPLIGYVDAPLLSLSFPQEPIEYGAPDGKPVQALFLIVSPTIRTHLALLGILAYTLHTPACTEALLRRDSPDAIIDLFRQAEAQRQASSPDTRTLG